MKGLSRGLRPLWLLCALPLTLPMTLPLASCLHPRLAAVPADATVVLPADDAPHRWAQTEWWHVHADLVEPASGETVSVFAAFLVQRTALDSVAALPVSLFVNPVQAAWVQIRVGDRVWAADRLNVPDLFTAGNRGPGLDLHHGNWRLTAEGGALVLIASAGPHRLELRLEPTRSPTLPGASGRVELVPDNAHLWMQDEGMTVRARWRQAGLISAQTRWLVGEGFFKHQWGRLYDPGLDGFTWISMDLPGVGELAVAWLHDEGQAGVAGSLAWLRPLGGQPVPIPLDQLTLEPIQTWHSRRSGADWPVAWQLTGPDISLNVQAVTEAQEIWSFPAPLWVGSARAQGTVLGQAVDCSAFLEQAGARVSPFRSLLRSRVPKQVPKQVPNQALAGPGRGTAHNSLGSQP